MRKGITGLILALVVAGGASAASWETTSMRAPGGGLIRVGSSSQEVLQQLGQPLGKRAAARAAAGPSGRKHQTWSYRGADGLYTLTIAGGKVTRIEVTPDR